MPVEQRRARILQGVFLCCFLLIIFRLAFLQLWQHRFYQQRSLEQRTRLIELAAWRGDILDRHGNVLAGSRDTYSVYKRSVGWLARKLPKAEAEELAAQDPRNSSLLVEKQRIYPKGTLASQLIGFVGLDNQGLSGVELAFEDYLKGKQGKLVTEGDPSGRELYGALRELEPGANGLTVTLTIDENIQYVAERELAAQLKRSRAQAGSCIVMDARNGEILALASKPDFDPNDYGRYDRRLWHPRFLDPFEPGSTFKAISVAAGLAEGEIDLQTKLKALDTLEIGGRVIKNSRQIKWAGPTISLSRMLEESINTGSAQIGIKLGPERFHRQISNFGFGERTGLGLGGESRGILRPWRRWSKPDAAMISFGQGIAVTPLQLIASLTPLAGEGELCRPLLVRKVESDDGRFVRSFSSPTRRVVSPAVAGQMKQLLRNVVTNGSGRRASLEAFAVCGKTGTAQKAAPGGRGYQKDNYFSSFIGFAPQREPRVIALVIIDDPRDSIWGEAVAAPVFRNVVEFTLRYLNVKPDML